MASSTPPLLLTKRLTAFLSANTSPSLPSLLITSPTGKLLAHASPHPVSVLRTHATVAASLLSIHASNLSLEESSEEGEDDESERADEAGANKAVTKPQTVTVQTDTGVVLIRRLNCGLLFVCIGISTDSSSSSMEDATAQAQLDPGEASASLTVPPPPVSTSPSDAGSHLSSAVGTSSSVADAVIRRHAIELAKWLDDKLGTLTVPDEGVGGE